MHPELPPLVLVANDYDHFGINRQQAVMKISIHCRQH